MFLPQEQKALGLRCLQRKSGDLGKMNKYPFFTGVLKVKALPLSETRKQSRSSDLKEGCERVIKLRVFPNHTQTFKIIPRYISPLLEASPKHLPSFSFLFYVLFWSHCTAYGILVPNQGISPWSGSSESQPWYHQESLTSFFFAASFFPNWQPPLSLVISSISWPTPAFGFYVNMTSHSRI